MGNIGGRRGKSSVLGALFILTAPDLLMFKRDRDLAERSRSQLKRNEVRGLRSELKSQWNSSSMDELFEGKPSIISSRLANRTIVYSTGEMYMSLLNMNDSI